MDPKILSQCTESFIDLYKGTGKTLFEVVEKLKDLGFCDDVIKETVFFVLRDQLWD